MRKAITLIASVGIAAAVSTKGCDDQGVYGGYSQGGCDSNIAAGYGNQNCGTQNIAASYGNQGCGEQTVAAGYGNQGCGEQTVNTGYGNQGCDTQSVTAGYGNQGAYGIQGVANSYANQGGCADEGIATNIGSGIGNNIGNGISSTNLINNGSYNVGSGINTGFNNNVNTGFVNAGNNDSCGDQSGNVAGTYQNNQNAALARDTVATRNDLSAAQQCAEQNQNVAAGNKSDNAQSQYSTDDEYRNKAAENESHEASGCENRARSGKSAQNEDKLRVSNHKSREGELHVAEDLDHSGKVKTIEECDEEVELAEHVQSEKDLCNNEKICKKKWVKRKHNRKSFDESCGNKKAGKIVRKRNNNSNKVDNCKFNGANNRGGCESEEKSYADIKKSKSCTDVDKDAETRGAMLNNNSSAFLKADAQLSTSNSNLDMNNDFFKSNAVLAADKNTNTNVATTNTQSQSC